MACIKLEDISKISIKDINLTVIYDNNPYREDLKTAWGFSCLIRGADKNILFDTGRNGTILMENIKELKISPSVVDMIVLSHVHDDHTGGLSSFLKENNMVTVYITESFPENISCEIEKYGAKAVRTKEPLELCKGIYSTGELGTFIKEQSLIVKTNKGLIIITGCAHPGIVGIVNMAKDLMGGKVLLVLGGFHLGDKSKKDIDRIVFNFKEMGVNYVGPSHCTGDKARTMFEEEYRDNFISVGVGKKIKIEDLDINSNLFSQYQS